MIDNKLNNVDIEYVKAVRRRKIILLIAFIIIVILLLIVFYNSMSEDWKTAKIYTHAEELLSNKDYLGARKEFEKCNEYRDAQYRILESYYLEGVELYNYHNYTTAIRSFESSRGYSDSRDKIAMCYKSVYKSAVDDAWERQQMMSNNGELDSVYNDIKYALFDITGDGINELIIRQQYNKHGYYYWFYQIESDKSSFMGEIDDEGSIYGYKSGVLFLYCYKKFCYLAQYEWIGSGFSGERLVEWDLGKKASEPKISDFEEYYDTSRFLGEITGFEFLSKH